MIEDIYKPVGSLSLAEITDVPLIRLGIQAPPGKGKTYSALTFPNPVVLNFNKGLGAHTGRGDVIDVPFWDGKFCDKIHPRSGTANPANKKDALIDWLLKEGMKLHSNQTLVVDGNTEVEAAFHVEYQILGPPITKGGGFDKYDEWKKKGYWYSLLIETLKAIPCSMVYITHEVVERAEDGELTGRARPLLTGQAGDKIVGDMTDWFRQWAVAKPKTPERVAKFKSVFANDNEEILKWMLESTPKEHETIYLWQTQSDERFELKTSSLFNAPKYIVANYSSFNKYKRKIT